MSKKIKKGTEVTWTSSGQGTQRTKTGTVVALLEGGIDVRDRVPKATKVSQIMTRQPESTHRRYLVKVTDADKVSFYVPRAATIEKQNGAEDTSVAAE